MNRPRELRKARGLTSIQLAKILDLSESAVRYIERGERGFSMESLKRCCDFFGVSDDYLLGKSAEQMFNDFVDSIRMDFVGESMDSAGDVVQRLSDSIAEPMRSKLEILFLLREVNSPESLSMILELAKLRRATEEFSGED